ncbi:hypothetical protein HDU79_007094, partial [Rhizoclosmatium sp. JEL0117]
KYRHNMHFIWDQFMIEADIQDNYGNSFDKYVASIIGDIMVGKYNSVASSWLTCQSPVKTDSGLVVKTVCPIEWSVEGNDLNCASVWDNTGSLDPANPSDDLYTNGYYAANKDIARLQLAKAGLRLAAALNTLVPAKPIDTYYSGFASVTPSKCTTTSAPLAITTAVVAPVTTASGAATAQATTTASISTVVAPAPTTKVNLLSNASAVTVSAAIVVALSLMF